MIIDTNMLNSFGASCDAPKEFKKRFPDGLDIGGLWRSGEERAATWEQILSDSFLRKYISWAIDVGILPARITANLHKADLYGANLYGANLSEAIICSHTLGIDINLPGLVKVED